MKPQILQLLLFLFSCSTIFAQESGSISPFQNTDEIYFSFQLDNPDHLQKLTRIVTIDNVKGNTVFAYADEEEFAGFLKMNLPFTILPTPGADFKNPKMRDEVKGMSITDWDFYPTYSAYLDMMDQFATDYPDICQSFSIGQTVNGRELMMLKISDNVAVREAEPQFLYTGTIHGDELVGYVLLLRLADYLLSNYGSDPEVTAMVDNIEIWINPLANPDGTYAGGNNTVLGSIRNNANNVNLNRNYPDPEDGQHPDGHAWQPETLAFMQLAEENNFVMSANTHAGEEVINYPWDTWPRLAADNNWWVFVSREYADTVHKFSPSTYLDGFDNGITNGYAWYTISGGRQDYMNYFHNCREVTMELSMTKKLSASQLPNHWNWNYRSLINYLKQCTYGVNGVVTDQNTGEPIPAKVFIEGHDFDNSFVMADSANGFYQRLLDAGTYSITFSADGYLPVTVFDVAVSRYSTTTVNVQLSSGDLQAAFSASETAIPTGSAINFTDESLGNPVAWHWEFEGGQPASSDLENPSVITYHNPGIFDVTLLVTNAQGDTSTLTKTGYVNVYNQYLMSSQTVSVCSGIFFDSGGEDGNYSDNEDYEMTFFPFTPEAKINADFRAFNLEAQSSCSYDWLQIFDGLNSSSNLLGTWCGTTSPGQITASNPDGALTFVFHSDVNVNLTGWMAILSCKAEQELQIPHGWSGISLFVEPENPDIENLFTNILDDMIILVGNDGVFWPQQNINTLNSWDSRQGYLVKLNAAAEIIVPGTLIQDNTLYLSAGWNYLPVLSSCPVSTAYFMDTFDGSLVVIKEAAGTKIFWPAMGIYTLSNLEPGKAYLIYLTSPVTFGFPVCD